MSTLKHRWDALRAETPTIRIRDAARRLDVSEAALLETRLGAGVISLSATLAQLAGAVPAFGSVMSLARNEAAVHEKENAIASVREATGAINLTAAGFALDLPAGLAVHSYGVEDSGPKGALRSIQFFGATGTALWKLYARTGTDLAAFEAFIAGHSGPQGQPAAFARQGETAPNRSPTPADVVTLPNSATQQLLERAVADAVSLAVETGNGSVTQHHRGPVKRIVRMGSWLNILDPGFDWHLDEAKVAKVQFEGADIPSTASLRLLDDAGATLARLGCDRDAPASHARLWAGIVDAVLKGS